MCLTSYRSPQSAYTPKDIAMEAEKTAQQFHRDTSDLDDEGRYYWFNVVPRA